MVSEIENLPGQLNTASVFVDENIQQGRGDNIALFYGDETITYQDVSKMVNRTGNALKNSGVNPEDRVMLLLLDSPEFVASFFGAIKIGAVPIPTNTMLKANDFLYFLNDSGAKTLIVHDILLPEIEKIKADLRYLKNRIQRRFSR